MIDASAEADPAFQRGLAYLYQVRSLAPLPDLVDLMQTQHRVAGCTWIGSQIEAINVRLQTCLEACQACFHPWQRQPAQIFAAPLASRFGLDGVCNLQSRPATILVDVGRVVPEDWLALVAHEYTHVQIGSPGHGAEFAAMLTHLCLGLGLDLGLDPPLSAQEITWRALPAYRTQSQPQQFWLGVSSEWPAKD